ncbi:PIG-L family deacetylase, partial [Streptomyces cylindrosporus]
HLRPPGTTATRLAETRRPPCHAARPLCGLLALLSDRGVPTAVLCFTHGEASTLHGTPGDLHTVRAGELFCAAGELGVDRVGLSGHPDGSLTDNPVSRLAAEVTRLVDERRPTHLPVFDTGVSLDTVTINRPRMPRCSPPAELVSRYWAGRCRDRWRIG